jgi:hypothetical protein
MQISLLGYKIDLEILILIVVLYLVIVVNTACNCTDVPGLLESFRSRKEGFTGANTNYGQSAPYSLQDYSAPDTSKWGQPSLVYGNGKGPNKATQEILNRPEQKFPLPEGQLDMFYNTPFKPECCGTSGSVFSTSTGCACMNPKTVNYLNSRGGNNVPYSEY